MDLAKFTKDEFQNKVAESYQSGKNTSELAKEFGCCVNKINQTLARAGVKVERRATKSHLRLNPEILEALMGDYTSGMCYASVGRKYNISNSTARRWIKSLGGGRPKGWRKYTLDEHFFDEIDSEAKAYFLGLLYADGFVNEQGNIGISLQIRDRDILEAFRLALNSNSPIIPIVVKATKRANESPQARFNVYSKYMVDRLTELGCTPRKSLTLKYPSTLRKSLQHHFIRGYIDGDGWICGTNPKSISMGMIGTENFIRAVGKVISDRCSVHVGFCLDKTKKLFRLNIGGGNQVRTVLDYLYIGATISLKRKRDLAESVKTKAYIKPPRKLLGSACASSKLTESIVLVIYEETKRATTRKERAIIIRYYADKLNVRLDTIQAVVYGRSWSHLTGIHRAGK